MIVKQISHAKIMNLMFKYQPLALETNPVVPPHKGVMNFTQFQQESAIEIILFDDENNVVPTDEITSLTQLESLMNKIHRKAKLKKINSHGHK